MVAKKRGKRPGLRARSKNARNAPALKFTNDPHAKIDVSKLKLRAGGSKSVQKRLAVQVPRLDVIEREELYKLRDHMRLALVELFDLRGKLASCRQIMEANDPLNAYSIFGPPVPSPAQAEGESPQAQPAEAPSMEEVEAPDDRPEGVFA